MAADIRRALELGVRKAPVGSAIDASTGSGGDRTSVGEVEEGGGEGESSSYSRRPLLTRRVSSSSAAPSPSSAESTASSAFASAAAHNSSFDGRSPSRGAPSVSAVSAESAVAPLSSSSSGQSSLSQGGRQQNDKNKNKNNNNDHNHHPPLLSQRHTRAPRDTRHPGASSSSPPSFRNLLRAARSDTVDSRGNDSNAGSLTSCSYKERRRIRREQEQRKLSEKRRREYGPCLRFFLDGCDKARELCRTCGEGVLLCLCLPFLCSDQ